MTESQLLGVLIIVIAIALVVLFIGLAALRNGSETDGKRIGTVLMIISIVGTIGIAVTLFDLLCLVDKRTVEPLPVSTNLLEFYVYHLSSHIL